MALNLYCYRSETHQLNVCTLLRPMISMRPTSHQRLRNSLPWPSICWAWQFSKRPQGWNNQQHPSIPYTSLHLPAIHPSVFPGVVGCGKHIDVSPTLPPLRAPQQRSFCQFFLVCHEKSPVFFVGNKCLHPFLFRWIWRRCYWLIVTDLLNLMEDPPFHSSASTGLHDLVDDKLTCLGSLTGNISANHYLWSHSWHRVVIFGRLALKTNCSPKNQHISSPLRYKPLIVKLLGKKKERYPSSLPSIPASFVSWLLSTLPIPCP